MFIELLLRWLQLWLVMISDMVQVNCEGEQGIMRTHEVHCILTEQRWRTRSRSWSITAPKFKVKLLTLALLASMLIHKPASALILSQHKSDSTSTRNLDNNINFDSLVDKLRKQQASRRTLLQDGRFRPTPTGYPPPGDNEQVVPHAPSFDRRPP